MSVLVVVVLGVVFIVLRPSTKSGGSVADRGVVDSSTQPAATEPAPPAASPAREQHAEMVSDDLADAVATPTVVPAGTIAGTVVDESGAGVPGATVLLRMSQRVASPFDYRDAAPALVVEADERGNFLAADLAPDRWYVHAEHAECLASGELEAHPGDRVELRVTRAGWYLEVFAFEVLGAGDGERTPLAGIELRARGRGAAPHFEARATTDGDGSARLGPLPDQELELWGASPSYPSETRYLSSRIERVDLRFRRGVTVTGEVVDEGSRNPIARARISSGLLGETFTDERGRFAFAEAARIGQQTALVAQAEHRMPSLSYVMEIAATDAHVVFEMSPALRIAGVVQDPTGAPIADATIAFRSSLSTNPFTSEPFEGTVRSDPDGRFALDQVGPGIVYRLDVSHPSEARVGTVRVGPFRESTQLEPIVLGWTSVVLGRVDGCGVDSRATVEARFFGSSGATLPGELEAVVRADSERGGAFRMEGLPPGLWAFGVAAIDDEKVVDTGFLIVDLAEGAREEVLLDSRANVSIEGVVRGPNSEVVDYVHVVATGEGPAGRLTQALSGANGVFRLALSRPTGEGVRLSFVDLRGRYRPVEALDAVIGERNLRVALETFDGAMSGYVTDQDGRPVSAAFVALREEDTGRLIARVGMPDTKGFFNLQGIRDCSYSLYAMDFEDEYVPAKLEGVKLGDSPVRLHLKHR